jgi:glycolate oxidase iron-sulfur subunit
MTAGAFAGLDPCVHCGFCLQSCPTFLVTGDESDSPRGRIVLMRALARGEADAGDPALVLHLDRCLGCRGCEPVCPSGVRYGEALEASRSLIAERRPVPAAARWTAALLAEPRWRGPWLGAARAVRPLAGWLAGGSRPGFLAGMLAATVPWRDARESSEGPGRRPAERGSAPEPKAAGGPAGAGRVAALFKGCIMQGLFGHVHQATERTLAANGYRFVEVPGQGCCGALHAHAGLHREAQELARANVAAFEAAPDAAIVVDSAGCGAMLREYPRLLVGDSLAQAAARFAARVADVTEALAARGPKRGGPLPLAVAYDPPCHLLHAQRVAEAPLRVLEAIPELRQVRHAEADLCCGSAGSYSLTQPALSRAILQRKIEALAQARPDVVATGNPGCIMQIGAGLRAVGLDLPVVHPVELLDRSYARAGYYSE